MTEQVRQNTFAKEPQAINDLAQWVIDFYKNPKNIQAFEAWKHNKEATRHED